MLSSILPKLTIVSESEAEGVFRFEPLEKTYGLTLGNALRRSMLSALPGLAVTGVRIKGTVHEFSTIKGLQEDVLDFILNVKQIRVRALGSIDKPVSMMLEVKGEKIITAADIKCPAEVEVVNKDLYLARLIGKGASFSCELIVENGRGYRTAKETPKNSKKSIDIIPIDALYTPVRAVRVDVDSTRVGQATNFDQLTLTVKTDGTETPLRALNLAAAILVEHFTLLVNEDNFKPEIIDLSASEEIIPENESSSLSGDITIEDLGLATRVLNSLHSANINTVNELVECSIDDLTKLKNFGQKSLVEIEEKLNERGLSLKGLEDKEDN